MILLYSILYGLFFAFLAAVIIKRICHCVSENQEDCRIKKRLHQFLNTISNERKIVSISIHKPDTFLYVTVISEDELGKQEKDVHDIPYKHGLLFHIKQHIFDMILLGSESSAFTTFSRNPDLPNHFALNGNYV